MILLLLGVIAALALTLGLTLRRAHRAERGLDAMIALHGDVHVTRYEP